MPSEYISLCKPEAHDWQGQAVNQPANKGGSQAPDFNGAIAYVACEGDKQHAKRNEWAHTFCTNKPATSRIQLGSIIRDAFNAAYHESVTSEVRERGKDEL